MTSYWRPVAEWSLGGNDRYGDCTFVSLANFCDLVQTAIGQPQTIMEAEAEHFYAVESGFNPNDLASDRGAVLREVIADWAAKGWPGDDTLKPVAWGACAHDRCAEIVERYGAQFAWVMLPKDLDGDWDWSDDAVLRNAPGEGAHAILVVEKTPIGRVVITWAAPQGVSDAWWARYAQPDAYWAEHPRWPARSAPAAEPAA